MHTMLKWKKNAWVVRRIIWEKNEWLKLVFNLYLFVEHFHPSNTIQIYNIAIQYIELFQLQKWSWPLKFHNISIIVLSIELFQDNFAWLIYLTLSGLCLLSKPCSKNSRLVQKISRRVQKLFRNIVLFGLEMP